MTVVHYILEKVANNPVKQWCFLRHTLAFGDNMVQYWKLISKYDFLYAAHSLKAGKDKYTQTKQYHYFQYCIKSHLNAFQQLMSLLSEK